MIFKEILIGLAIGVPKTGISKAIMTEFACANSMCSPLIAVLTSDEADELFRKSCLNFADMLAPFSSVTINIRDPVGNKVSSRLSLDVRDIRKSGFLLSHTVLPHVLRENVVASFAPSAADGVFSTTFLSSFFYWFEPAAHDFLRSYVSCIFVVSADEADPLEALNKLQYQQHMQQHGQTDSMSSLTLAHCAPPKWMLPNILKYFVVVQDVSQHSDDRTNEVFASVSKKYGSAACHLLRINSTVDSKLPDPWAAALERRYRGLDAGLERARRDILERSNVEGAQEVDNGSQYILSSMQISRSSTASSFSTISATVGNGNGIGLEPSGSLFTTSLSIPQILPGFRAKQSTSPQTVPTMVNDFIPTTLSAVVVSEDSSAFQVNAGSTMPSISHGCCLDTVDRERVRMFIEGFVRGSLVPFVEHQLHQQNEALANRRTIGRSLNSMRKWLSAASSTTTTANANVSYGADSSEWQTRCMADLAFQFGLYNFAHQLYQSLKKDFANDQAWLHHAGALEMAAITSFLGYVSSNATVSSSGANATELSFSPAIIALLQKNYPQRYMDNAINYYLNVCMQPLLAMRCVLMSVLILTCLELYTDAANHLIQLNTLSFSDLYAGVVLEQAGHLLRLADKRRRMAFYMMLAGHRFHKAALAQFALTCYRRVLPLLRGPRPAVRSAAADWTFAEDQILYMLTAEHEHLVALDGNMDGARFVVDCAAKLLRANGRQSVEQQQVFLTNYVNLAHRYRTYVQPAQLAIPHIDMQNIRVFYGDSFGSSRSIHSTTVVPLNLPDAARIRFYSAIPEGFRPEEGFTDVALDICQPFLVWEELESTIVSYHNARCAIVAEDGGPTEAKADPQPLFSDEWTDKGRSEWRTSPVHGPITVRLALFNPLAIPLLLKNLRLGVSDSNGQAGTPSSSLAVEKLEKLVLPSSFDSESLAGGRESPRNVDSLTFSKQHRLADSCEKSVIHLSVTPSEPTDVKFERLEFELCCPRPPTSHPYTPTLKPVSSQPTFNEEGEEPCASITCYIPLEVKGRRIFATKQQRRTPTYSFDNRLCVRAIDYGWPLLDFRMAGSTANVSNRALSCHRVNAYCNQIYQVLMDVENVGSMPVTRLYLATDRAALVSLSEERGLADEPSTGKWRMCASSWATSSPTLTATNGSEGQLIHEASTNINPQKPLAPGGRLTLRLAFRAPATAERDHQISVLFVYLNSGGAARQFRYRLAFSTQMLLNASLRLLNPQDGLCALQLRNAISARDSVLVRIELQRFRFVVLTLNDVPPRERTAKYKGVKLPFKVANTFPNSTVKPDVDVGIRPIFKNPVLESEQSQNYCFFLTAAKGGEEGAPLKELWMSDFVADIPEWSHLLPVDAFLPFLVAGVSAKLQEYRSSDPKLTEALDGLSLDSQPAADCLYHLRLAVLWKAYITNSDGTVATVFGETLLPNPFASVSAVTGTTDSNLCRIPTSPNVFIATNEERALSASADPFRVWLAQSFDGQSRGGGSSAPPSNSPKFMRDIPNPFLAPMDARSAERPRSRLTTK